MFFEDLGSFRAAGRLYNALFALVHLARLVPLQGEPLCDGAVSESFDLSLVACVHAREVAEKAAPAGAAGGGAGLRTDSDIAAQARGLTNRQLQKAGSDWLTPLPDGEGGLGE